MTRFSSRDFRFPIANGSTGEDEEDTTSFSEARQQQRELLTETLDEQDETFSEQRQEQRQELTDELQDEEEDEEPAPLASSIDDLQAAADPEAFDRTFRIEKSDVPQAIEDRNPIPFPWEGIPRVAMVFNFNYVWDDQEEEWVRDEGNGLKVLASGTETVSSFSITRVPTGVDNPVRFVRAFVRPESPGDVPEDFETGFDEPGTGAADLSGGAVWDTATEQWEVVIGQAFPVSTTVEWVLTELPVSV